MSEAGSQDRSGPAPSRDAQRSRLNRFLKRGGVLVRDAVGGAIGVRWADATRCGREFNSEICEARLASGRLRPIVGSRSAFELTPPPHT